jgi:hypothetical protein
MSITQNVAAILKQHVTLEVEGIDRMYLNVYVPRLQWERGVVRFFKDHLGQAVASSALMAPRTEAFVAAIESFVKAHPIPVVEFRKGERKDDVMAEHLKHFGQPQGVVFVGKAQEKTSVFRTQKRRNPQTGCRYAWIVKSTALLNQYYFYCVDCDFGPFFLKFGSYFPHNAKLCLNGHEYVKRQLEKEGIAYQALDNGILSCAGPGRLQKICDGLSGEKIAALLVKWLRRLPPPFTAFDQQAGYCYHLSMLQADSPSPKFRSPRPRSHLLRGSHSRETRPRASRSGATDLRAPGQACHAAPFPHRRDYGRRHALAARRLQDVAHQAVPQTGTGAAHRDHHQ